MRRYDGTYIAWNGQHGEMVFDVSMWNMSPGNHLVAVKGARADKPTRMGGDGGGRAFVSNADGTISPKTAQHLVLGVGVPPRTAPNVVRSFSWIVPALC